MNVMQSFQVGIMSHSGMKVQRSQGLELIHTLGRILGRFGRQVTLHHCGSSQSDNIGRVFAVNAGWQVEAHPACKAASMLPWRTAVLVNQSESIHPARMREERNREVIRRSHLIVVVESDYGMPSELVRKAKAEGRAVIQIKQEKPIVSPAVISDSVLAETVSATVMAKLIAPPAVISGVQMDWLVDEPN